MATVYFLGTVLVLVALAGWWIRRLMQRHDDHSRKRRQSAERERADDLRDCLAAHQSMVPDLSMGAPDDPSRDPEASGAESSPDRRRREERWRRAQSALDPELPAEPESRH
jgi:hypothetical protein